MVIYNFSNNLFQRVETTTFTAEGILERQHLQTAIKSKIDIIAPDCLVISEEFSQWSESQRRIDLLAIDKQANLVVIELKRTETGEHMELQALRYASMVSTLTFHQAIDIYQRYLASNGHEINAKGHLLDFLDWEEAQEDNFGVDVRIILASSNFSKELTTSVMWLNERGIDIRCVRLTPYKFDSQILIDIQQVIPLPEAENYQIRIRQKSEEIREARRHSKDYTRYIFKDKLLNKRKLVLAVVHEWFYKNNPLDFSELTKAFPQSLQGRGLFAPEENAKEIYKKHNIYRHFLGDEEILVFPNSDRYAISNQWGKGNIGNFIKQAKILGFDIEEANEKLDL